MAPLAYGGNSNVGKATLIGGWVFVSLAIYMLCFALRWRWKNARLGSDDLLLLLATLIAVVLACQATWAVSDEGQGQNIQYENASQIHLVIRVCLENEF